jgi:hypothetical protein
VEGSGAVAASAASTATFVSPLPRGTPGESKQTNAAIIGHEIQVHH